MTLIGLSACALAADHEGDAPHGLLLPEIALDEGRFPAKVEQAMARYGHCVIAVSEGIKGPVGTLIWALISAVILGGAFYFNQLFR